MRRAVHELLAEALAGRLVLFLGAGVSSTAGLPLWAGLIDELAVEAGLTDSERAAIRRMNPLDAARLVGDRLGDVAELDRVIARRMSVAHYGLLHALLASLPVSEAVTTNYDECFENASSDAGHPTSVIPYRLARQTDRWLLKLHGSVTDPHDLVLTREDYLRYGDRRSALAAIVQAMLITRHMLFVGFSLTDDNFHQIVDAVRKAIRTNDDPGDTQPFATALVLQPEPVMVELWRRDVRCIPIESHQSEPFAESARQLEILIDVLLAQAGTPREYLLDPRFESILDDDERALRDALVSLADSTAGRTAGIWSPVAQLLSSYGSDST